MQQRSSTCSTHGEMIRIYILVENLVEKTLLGRPRRRWQDVEMDVKETGYESVDWILLARDAFC
jgi:hypothetical protein